MREQIDSLEKSKKCNKTKWICSRRAGDDAAEQVKLERNGWWAASWDEADNGKTLGLGSNPF